MRVSLRCVHTKFDSIQFLPFFSSACKQRIGFVRSLSFSRIAVSHRVPFFSCRFFFQIHFSIFLVSIIAILWVLLLSLFHLIHSRKKNNEQQQQHQPNWTKKWLCTLDWQAQGLNWFWKQWWMPSTYFFSPSTSFVIYWHRTDASKTIDKQWTKHGRREEEKTLRPIGRSEEEGKKREL